MRRQNRIARADLTAVPKSQEEQDDGDGALDRSQPNHAADVLPTESLQIINDSRPRDSSVKDAAIDRVGN
jgi:hypothetical protein